MSKAKSTHVLVFKGNGSWKDTEGVIYPSGKEIRIESELSEKEFLESRKDIKFMVNYGQLSITTATAGEAKPPVNPPTSDNVEPPKVEKPKENQPKIVNTNK